MFLFEKKNQNTFPHAGGAWRSFRLLCAAPTDKSFLLLFFKKEDLPFLRAITQ
jgi:hypothetical protein